MLAPLPFSRTLLIRQSSIWEKPTLIALRRQLSALFASKVDVTAGPVKVMNSQKADSYLDLAKQYESLANQGRGEDPDGEAAAGFLGVIVTGISVSEMEAVEADTDIVVPAFKRGMMGSPGEEDYDG